MGKRSQQLRCTDCGAGWWVWFDNKTREQMQQFAADEQCPDCESSSWQLTDATRFAGGKIHSTDEHCPECDYDAKGAAFLRCGSGHEWVPHEDLDQEPPTKAAYRDAVGRAKDAVAAAQSNWEYLDGEERFGTLDHIRHLLTIDTPTGGESDV